MSFCDSGISKLVIVGTLFWLASANPSVGFDAGHHHDLTSTVLTEAGFNEDATNSAVLANWLTDYYSAAPTPNPRLRAFLKTLHFDNLENASSVKRYFGWLVHNTRQLSRQAAKENDRIKMLAVIGIATHAIQDFYSHSNWVERISVAAEEGVFRYLPYVGNNSADGDLYTGSWPGEGARSHGNFAGGLNKDSIVRRGWDEAYVHAHLATRWMVENIRTWAEGERPGFWNRTAGIKLAGLHRKQLKRDLDSAKAISMVIRAKVLGLPASDGHWKGNLSGDGAAFTSAVAEFSGWKNSFMTRYFKSSETSLALANRLMSSEIPPETETKPVTPGNWKAIIVTVHSFSYRGREFVPSNMGAIIKIDGRVYEGRNIRRTNWNESNGQAAWKEIHIGDGRRPKHKVEISLVGFSSARARQPKQLDINFRPEKESLSISYVAKTGNVTGDVNVFSSGQPQKITVSGDGSYPVTMVFSIESRRIVPGN